MATEVALAGELLAARLARVARRHVLRDQVPPQGLAGREVGLALEAFLRFWQGFNTMHNL